MKIFIVQDNNQLLISVFYFFYFLFLLKFRRISIF